MPDIDARIQELLGKPLAAPPDNEAAAERVPSGLARMMIASLLDIDRLLACWRDQLSRIQVRDKRGALRQELADHLRDAYDRQIELGRDPEAAWAHVKERFGDYKAILGELESLHQPLPLWEIATRVASPIAAVMVATLWLGVQPQDLFRPVTLLVMLVLAPLATLDWRDWGWRGSMNQVTRVLAFGLMLYTFRIEGCEWRDAMLGVVAAVAGTAVFRTFRRGRFTTRLCEVLTVFMMVGAGMGAFMVFKYLGDPSELGMGVAITFVVVFYGVVLARPRFPVLFILVICCHAVVWLALRAVLDEETKRRLTALLSGGAFVRQMHWWQVRLGMAYAVAGLLGTWLLCGRRNLARWFGAAGVVGMILSYITVLKNLDLVETLPGMMVVVNVPLLLWLVPATGWVLRKCGVGGGGGVGE